MTSYWRKTALAGIAFIAVTLFAVYQAPYKYPSYYDELSLISKFWFPVERNAERRIPQTNAAIVDVRSLDDNLTVAMISRKGSVFVSKNRGVDWQKFGPSVHQHNVNAFDISNEGNIVTVGGNTEILSASLSNNGALNWTKSIVPNVGRFNLLSVKFFSDGLRVLAVGEGGIILLSTDAGKTWARREIESDSTIIDVSISQKTDTAAIIAGGDLYINRNDRAGWRPENRNYLGSLNSVAIAKNSDFLITANSYGDVIFTNNVKSKKDWKLPIPLKRSSIEDVAISADAKHMIAITSFGLIQYSSDNGQTWNGTGVPTFSNQVEFIGKTNDAILIGRDGDVFLSSNGGKDWRAVIATISQELKSVGLAAKAATALAIDSSNNVLVSGDSGKSWQKSSINPQQRVDNFSVSANGEKGVAIEGNGQIIVSDNGGLNWRSVDQKLPESLASSVALSGDGSIILATSVQGKIYNSLDFGKNWNLSKFADQASFDGKPSIHPFADGEMVFVIGSVSNQTQKTTKQLWYSKDRGQTFTPKRGSVANPIIDFAATNADAPIYKLEAGIIHYSSDDQGKTWKESIPSVETTDDNIAQCGRAEGNFDTRCRTEDTTSLWQSFDTGDTWELIFSNDLNGLSNLAISEDGRSIVIAGKKGVIVRSTDGGQTWTNVNSGTEFDIVDAVASDGGRVWSVLAANGQLIQSSDEGNNWQVEAAPYLYVIAPWYFATVVLFVVFIFVRVTDQPPEVIRGAMSTASSDAPIASALEDKLDFAPLAEAISKFLANINTIPPLTLAILGEWGTGKSSIMQMVKSEIESKGMPSVWFNAWHHQNENETLAALFSAIRTEAIPKLLSPTTGISMLGIKFRWSLFRSRIKSNFGLFLLGVAIASVFVGFGMSDAPDRIAAYINSLQSNAETNGSNIIEVLATVLFYGFPTVSAFFILVFLIWTALKPFGLKPSDLVAQAVNRNQNKYLPDVAGMRMKFAKEFREVTDALQNQMVIIIDDLDRCQPEQTLQILETVNFLTSSGKCFVLFGMSKPRVIESLGFLFQDYCMDDSVESTELAEEYLEKLVNIEIDVPKTGRVENLSLLTTNHEPISIGNNYISRLFMLFKKHAIWIIALAVLSSGSFLIGRDLLPQTIAAGIQQGVVLKPGTETGALEGEISEPELVVSDDQLTKLDQIESEESVSNEEFLIPTAQEPISDGIDREFPIVPLVEEGDTGLPFLQLLPVFLITTLAFMFALYVKKEQQKFVVRDSQVFVRALDIWSEIALGASPSPRSTKRFGNMLRFFVMLLTSPQRYQTYGQSWFPKIGRRPKNTTDDDLEQTIAEHRVVALGALYSAYGSRWRDAAVHPNTLIFSNQAIIYQEAVSNYQQLTGTSWPPTDEELDTFAKSIRGIKFWGEPILIDPPEASQSSTINEKSPTDESPTRE